MDKSFILLDNRDLIRHIYISENVDLEAIEKAKKLAEDMLHSSSTQVDYIKTD